eukprot:UN07584
MNVIKDENNIETTTSHLALSPTTPLLYDNTLMNKILTHQAFFKPEIIQTTSTDMNINQEKQQKQQDLLNFKNTAILSFVAEECQVENFQQYNTFTPNEWDIVEKAQELYLRSLVSCSYNLIQQAKQQ